MIQHHLIYITAVSRHSSLNHLFPHSRVTEVVSVPRSRFDVTMACVTMITYMLFWTPGLTADTVSCYEFKTQCFKASLKSRIAGLSQPHRALSKLNAPEIGQSSRSAFQKSSVRGPPEHSAEHRG